MQKLMFELNNDPTFQLSQIDEKINLVNQYKKNWKII